MALLGRQTPTFHLRPSGIVSNAAVDAIEFYESLGPTLDPWQRWCLENGLGEDAQGYWAAPEVGLEVQRQNGKGGVTEPVELTGLFVWGLRLITHTAHLMDTANVAFKRAAELVEGSDDLTRRVRRINDQPSAQAIELMDGSMIRFRTRTGKGGRGLSGELVTLDEAQELTPEQAEALVPTILAQANPQIWYTFTAPKTAAAMVVELRKRARAGEPGLAYAEWANPRDADLSDQRVLARVNPAYGIRVSARTLAVAKGALGEEGYARECGGIWPVDPKDEWLVIPRDAWLARSDIDAKMVGRPAFGIYVPPDRSYSAIAAAGERAAGGRMVEVTGKRGELDYRPGTAWLVPRAVELNEHDPSVFVVDDKATADALEAAGVVVHRASVADVVTGCQLLFDGVAGADEAGRDVWHIEQDILTAAVAGAVQRDVGGSWAWQRRNLTVDVAPLAAGSLALFGHSTPRVHRESEQPFFAAWR